MPGELTGGPAAPEPPSPNVHEPFDRFCFWLSLFFKMASAEGSSVACIFQSPLVRVVRTTCRTPFGALKVVSRARSTLTELTSQFVDLYLRGNVLGCQSDLIVGY